MKPRAGWRREAQGQMQHHHQQQAAAAGAQVPVLLVFRDAGLERAYQAAQAPRLRAHDLQAAAVYLAMVASGTLLYGVIATLAPSTRAAASLTNVDQCGRLIALSWLGPAAHLCLAWALGAARYTRVRTRVTLCLRAFYLAATAWRGFGVCGVGGITASAGGGGESAMSALIWRSGVIGMAWFAGAFPLTFWQHLLVHSGMLAVYSSLAPLVCGGVAHVQHGPAAVAAVAAAGHGLRALLLAGLGAVGPARAATAAAAATLRAPGGERACVRGLTFLQLLAGHVLPSFLLWCVEARSRAAWLAGQRRPDARAREAALLASASYSSLLRCAERALAAAAEDEAGASAGAGPGPPASSAGSCASSSGGAPPAQRSSSSSSSSDSAAGAGAGGSGAGAGAGAGAPVQALLGELPSRDQFDEESSSLPPTAQDAYVVLVLVALAWAGLGRLL
ncbi:hypothetical protein HT031_001426 [Scenedesmus sp. PABB004]|nr:hypothetical protein HT031_001426 [Scenedesmus sp. PABB004]